MNDILLLHGAIGAANQFDVLAEQLKHSFNVHRLNFPGHGGDALPDAPFSIESFAGYVLDFLNKNKITTVSIFGYSMGGYVALQLAKTNPERVNKIITLATKFYWDVEVAAKEIKMLQPAVIEEKLPAFARELAQRHQPTKWEELLFKTQELLQSLGKSNTLTPVDYKNISNAVLLMLGDSDKMVTLQETTDVFKQLPNASLAVLPRTIHPIEKADSETLVFYIKKFFN